MKKNRFGIFLNLPPEGQDAPPLNEDNYIGCFDGLGGAGSAIFVNKENEKHSNAWFGANFAREIINNIFQEFDENKSEDFKIQLKKSFSENQILLITKIINDELHNKAFEQELPLEKVKGSLAKLLPTTMSAAYIYCEENKAYIHCFNVGDSRLYGMSLTDMNFENSLFQISKDSVNSDIDGLDSVVSGSIETQMNNNIIHIVMNKDIIPFQIDYKMITLDLPVILFTCTDGVYYYLDSPMELEYNILEAINNSNCIEEFKASLEKKISETKYDDRSLSLNILGIENYNEIKDQAKIKYESIKKITENIAFYEKELRESYIDIYNRNKDDIEEIIKNIASIVPTVDLKSENEHIIDKSKKISPYFKTIINNMSKYLNLCVEDEEARFQLVNYLIKNKNYNFPIEIKNQFNKLFEIESLKNIELYNVEIKKIIRNNIWEKGYKRSYERLNIEERGIV